ncbi:MAG: hypothetical protein IPK32_11025 [Verrucomicrobiaceae bacterium]|nr:hypothetical protein [Verrucomicrobiaceae bacterium]
MSRTCGGAVLFDAVEKEALRRILWRLSEFSGVRVLTYCIMKNHFHVLAEVPDQKAWLQDHFEGADGEQKLMHHLRILYSKSYVEQLQAELAEWRRLRHHHLAEKRIAALKKRFCDISVFIKEVKERFSRWYNKRHERKGTLWMDRFKSVLVEGKGDPLLTMAAYIDLNPVRAGIVSDPKDYRWCGYAEALGGNRECQRGICRVTGRDEDGWRRQGAAEGYRQMLFDTAVEQKNAEGEVQRRGVSRERAQEVRLERGKLSAKELIRQRVRYFSDGAALGSREFVEEVFERQRGSFSPRRRSGARRMPRTEEPFYTLRSLVVDS